MAFLSFRKRKKKVQRLWNCFVFFFPDQWHYYCTTVNTSGRWERRGGGRPGQGTLGQSQPPSLLNWKKKKNQQQLSGVKPQRNGAASQSSSTFFIAIFVLFYQPYKALFICILSFFLGILKKKILLLVNCFFLSCFFLFGFIMWTDLPSCNTFCTQ